MVASEPHVIAQPLDPRDPDLPEKMQDILEKGKRSWLKNTEVCDMLLHYTKFNLRIAREPPCQPPGNCTNNPSVVFQHTGPGPAQPQQNYTS